MSEQKEAIQNALENIIDKSILISISDIDIFSMSEIDTLLLDRTPTQILYEIDECFNINHTYCYYDNYGNLCSTNDIADIIDFNIVTENYINNEHENKEITKKIEDDVFSDFIMWVEKTYPMYDIDDVESNIYKPDTITEDWEDLIKEYSENLTDEE